MDEEIIGVGPTSELSLRVSAATLCRVIFQGLEDGIRMLALEHKAFLDYYGGGSQVIVQVQPFGGGIRILDKKRFSKIAGGFNFDSKRSYSEGDFRIFIEPNKWQDVRNFFIRNLGKGGSTVLESSPTRELVEEFHDTLGIQLSPNQYTIEPSGVIVEDEPVPTANLRAAGKPTVRIYLVYEVNILDPGLVNLMKSSSVANTAQALQDLVLVDAQNGGKGRANAIMVVSEELIRKAYNDLSPENRAEPLVFEGKLLEGNVAAVLEGVNVPKYQHFV